MSASGRPVRSSDSCRTGSDTPNASAWSTDVWRHYRGWLRAVVAIPVVVVLVSQRGSLLSATDRIGRVSPAWLVLAFGAETISFLAAAELQHHLLAGAGVRVNRRSLIALSYAGTAISATLPAGSAISSRYTYRALVHRGTTAAAAAWVLAASAVLSVVTLAVLGLVGAELRGLGVLCSAVGGIVGVALLLGGAGTIGGLVWASRHRRRLEQLASSWSARCNAGWHIVARRLGRPSPTLCTSPVEDCSLPEDRARQDDQALGLAGLGVALGLAGANWVADIAALAVAFVALGLEVPWQGLLLAYAVTQLVTSVPLLPGSIGIAEGSMAAGLVCAGVHPTAAIAGVLVYRLVSFWMVLPAGWLAWTWLRRGEARSAGLLDSGALAGRLPELAVNTCSRVTSPPRFPRAASCSTNTTAKQSNRGAPSRLPTQHSAVTAAGVAAVDGSS